MLSLGSLLILPLSVVTAGVLHHREHAAFTLGNTANYLGRFGGKADNYGHSSDDEAEEKLRVIKITRTYAIPYPVPIPYPKQVPVPVPVANPVPYPVPQPVAVPVSRPFPLLTQGSFQSAADRLNALGYHHTYAVHQNLEHDVPNTHGIPVGDTTKQFLPERNFFQGDFANPSTHLSAENYGDNLFPGGDALNGGIHSGHGHIDAVADSVRKPFIPSPEYTPPELNERPVSQINQYHQHFAI